MIIELTFITYIGYPQQTTLIIKNRIADLLFPGGPNAIVLKSKENQLSIPDTNNIYIKYPNILTL